MKNRAHILISILSLFALPYCTQNVKPNQYLYNVSKENVISVIPETQLQDIKAIAKEKQNPPSKYEATKNLFQASSAPSQETFLHEEEMNGRCVFDSDPHVLFDDRLVAQVEVDPVLGRFVYLVPRLIGMPKSGSQKQVVRMPARHDNGVRADMKYFTALQFQYPRNSAFYQMTQEKMANSGFFSYRNKDTKVGFRVRNLKGTRTERDLVLVEHYCPHTHGCQFGEIQSRYHHLEPYAYCYYERKPPFRMLTQQRSGESRSIPVNMEFPKAFPIEEEWDILSD